MRAKITYATALIVVVAGGAGLWFYKRAEAREAPTYRTVAVERGALQASVSATGTLGAVRTVQVGTQVSGQVAAIYVDFNDKIHKGQLLARIDPTLQQQGVEDARAGLQRAQATLTQSQGEYARNKQLFDAKVITASEFGSAQSDFSVQQANVKSAQIALERAQKNLSYTNIYSPIDGVVVERDVDVGQTVAASLSAPQLFLIANDLSQMEILASVDESDIGQVKDGQTVHFTVQPYPDQAFSGTVKQVRLQSKTTDNVVNYTVVIGVANPDGKLLPGMTATVQFVTGSASDVLLVPNTALRFKPSAEVLATMGVTRDSTARRAGRDSSAAGGANVASDSARRAQWIASRGQNRGAQSGTQGSAQGGTRTGRASSTTLYAYDSTTKVVTPIRARTGLTDGSRTEVTSTRLKAGMQLIVGTTDGSTTASSANTKTTSANPLQPQQPRAGGRGPGGPGGF